MISLSLVSLYGRQNEYPIKHSLAAMRLASAISDLEGLEVKLEGFPLDDPSEKIAEKILTKNYQIVGLSSYLWTRSKVSEICRIISSRSPKTRLIIGGPEVVESSIDQNGLIYVAGEGEDSLKEIVLQYPNISKVSRKLPSLKKGTPLFSTEMLDMFNVSNPVERGFSWWESSRGCPYECAFCGHRSDSLRQYKLATSKEEIKNMNKLGVRRIFAVDPIFGGTRKNGKDVLRIFGEYAPDIAIRAYMRPEFLDTDYINLLSKANIEALEIGIQTINPDVPRFIRSNDLGKIDSVLPQLRQNRIRWEAQLITGLIGDTPQDHRESLRYVIEKLKPNQVYSYHLTVIRTTPLGSLTDKRQKLWIESDENNGRALQSSSYSREEMTQMLRFGSAITSLYNYLQQTPSRSVDVYSLDALYKTARPIIESGDLEISRALVMEDRHYLKNLWERLLGK